MNGLYSRLVLQSVLPMKLCFENFAVREVMLDYEL
jgi:hypothetical protein